MFQDEKVVLEHPERAPHLATYRQLDPNDITRIKIPCDVKWLKFNVYKKSLAKYNQTLRMFRGGTGGGRGPRECT